MAGDGDDFMSYKNPQLDATIEKAQGTIDEKARLALWHQCERILHDDQPYTFLYSQKVLVFMDKRITNFRTTRSGSNMIWTWCQPMPWYVPESLQKYH